jgi:ureidoglycolate lyase
MKTLAVHPLTRAGFAPFGDVIETEGADHFAINNATTERFHDLAAVIGDRTLISIFRGQPFAPPIAIPMVERHPLGSQAFVPLDRRPWLVVVAPSGPDGAPGEPVAFLATGTQGVNYAPGTWHHPLIALEAVSEFLVVDHAAADNLEEHEFGDGGWVIERLP